MRHGFLIVDKPVGPTSHDIVIEVRQLLHEHKVGHLGTLDPSASGVLVLAVGAKALKVIELFQGLAKEYEADISFGTVSSTYDREGVLTDVPVRAGWVPPEQGVIQRILADHFLGRVEQVPPQASAIHVGGERAYRKLRQGRGVSPPARQVEISKCCVLSYVYPHVKLRISCGAGTYIRSIAHDLGELLTCGGYLSGLRRIRVGEWSLDMALSPKQVTWSAVIPLKEVLKSFPSLELRDGECAALRQGQSIERDVHVKTIGWWEGLPVALLVPSEEHARRARPYKVL